MKQPALLAALALTLLVPVLAAEEPPACPMHAAHSKAEAELDQRGDRVMGFDHGRTAHHFRIEPDGGVIQVDANDANTAADAESRQAIRAHLAEIAGAFSRGDFSSPLAIHQRVLPGVPAAVHDFLRAQIGDHRTGDPLHDHAQ